MKKIPEKALRTLIAHTLADIDYGWHGSYGGGNENRKDGGIDIAAMKRSIKAINYIAETLLKTKLS